MGINLVKGQRIDLTKDKNIDKIMVGLGWDVNKGSSRHDFDLDCSVFLLDNNDLVTSKDDLVYYHNLISGKGVMHTGDNLTGKGHGDSENILIEFSKIPSKIEKVVFVVTIYEASRRKQNFGQVDNSYIRIVDQMSENELVRFDLKEEFSKETGVHVAEIYRSNGEWDFKAIGIGEVNTLKDYRKRYGLKTLMF